MDFIVVLAKIYPKSGCRDTVIEMSQDLIEDTLNEDGNIAYELLSSLDETTLTFIEKWQSLDALKEHMGSSHFQLFNSEIADFIKDMDIQVIGADKINL